MNEALEIMMDEIRTMQIEQKQAANQLTTINTVIAKLEQVYEAMRLESEGKTSPPPGRKEDLWHAPAKPCDASTHAPPTHPE